MYGTTKASNSQSNLERKEQASSIAVPDFKVYCKVIVVRIAWHCHEIGQIELNRMWILVVKPHVYRQVIYDGTVKNIIKRKDSYNNWVWGSWYSHSEESKETAISHHV